MGEERTLYYVKCFETSTSSLDSRFETIHKKHLEDEVRHLGLDEKVTSPYSQVKTINDQWPKTNDQSPMTNEKWPMSL